jgi:hypothetical protein
VAVPNLTATFDAKVWKTKLGFWIPKPLAKAFGWKKGKKLTLDLVITKPSGELAFQGPALLVSETEVTTPRIFENLAVGETIRVTAHNPQPRNKKSK